MARRLSWLPMLLLLGGCFQSEIPVGALRCEETRARPCPSGLVCAAGLCQRPGTAIDLAADSSLDGGVDTTPSDGDAGDLAPADGPAPIVCSLPIQIGAPTERLYEPALRAGALTLVARRPDAGYFMTSRSGQGEPFGDWEPSDLVLDEQDDLTFFFVQGKEWAIQATGWGPRIFELCALDNTCVSVGLAEGGGAPIEDDIDGPSVADELVEPMIVFNRTDALWIGRPTTAGALDHWTADALPFPGGDPAISPDGLFLVFERNGADGPADLWMARRQSIDESFSEPELLVAVNSLAADLEPELALLPTGGVELFFRSARQDFSKVFRSVCR